MDSTELLLQWVDATRQSFQYHKSLVDRAVAQIGDDAVHQALDENTNSIAVIMQHVAGNLASRWTDFLTSDGEKPERNRDGEFVDARAGRAALLAAWEEAWRALFGTLTSLTAADMARTVQIRGEEHSVPLAMQRSLAHTSYHVGQIVQLARHWAGDEWTTLTIPRGGSAAHNAAAWGNRDYARRAEPPAK